MPESESLTERPIPELIRKLAVPASVGFIFSTLYNVVDTFYAGLLSTQALAALSLSFPLFFIILASGVGISTGVSALISHALGAGDRKGARVYATQAITFSAILSIFLTAGGLLASPYLFSLLGASGSYLTDALTYMNVILLGTAFFVLVFVMNGCLSASGDTKTFRNFLIVGFLLNLVLDPWFMLGGFGIPAMGIAGVAWATVLIQVIGLAYMSYRVVKAGLLCRECQQMFMPRRKAFTDIARQGFPASLNMMTVALGIFVITFFISGFGQAAVAAYGIATRIEQLALLPAIGLNIATLVLVGQSMGAGNHERAREALRTSLKYGLIIMTAASVLLFLSRWLLMSFFTQDAAVISIGFEYLGVASLLSWAYTIMFINISALQGLKRPMFAIWIGLFRQLAAPAALFTLLAFVLAWGLPGIWWGIFLVNWAGAAITILYTRRVMGGLGSTESQINPSTHSITLEKS